MVTSIVYMNRVNPGERTKSLTVKFSDGASS